MRFSQNPIIPKQAGGMIFFVVYPAAKSMATMGHLQEGSLTKTAITTGPARRFDSARWF